MSCQSHRHLLQSLMLSTKVRQLTKSHLMQKAASRAPGALYSNKASPCHFTTTTACCQVIGASSLMTVPRRVSSEYHLCTVHVASAQRSIGFVQYFANFALPLEHLHIYACFCDRQVQHKALSLKICLVLFRAAIDCKIPSASPQKQPNTAPTLLLSCPNKFLRALYGRPCWMLIAGGDLQNETFGDKLQASRLLCFAKHWVSPCTGDQRTQVSPTDANLCCRTKHHHRCQPQGKGLAVPRKISLCYCHAMK